MFSSDFISYLRWTISSCFKTSAKIPFHQRLTAIGNEVERVISNELKNQLNDLSKAMNEAYYLGQNKINNSDNSDINSIKKQKLSNVKRLSNTRSNPITSFVEMCCKNLWKFTCLRSLFSHIQNCNKQLK